jgi:hypothetical protein
VGGRATARAGPAADDHGGQAGSGSDGDGSDGDGWVVIEVEYLARSGQADRLARGGVWGHAQ